MLDWLTRLSIEDKIFLTLAVVATGSMLINWRHLKPNLRIITLYPLTHFAAKFFSGYPIESESQKLIRESNLFDRGDAYSGLTAETHLKISLTFISYGILAIFFRQTFKNKSLKKKALFSIPLFWFMDVISVPKFVWESSIITSSIAYIAESLFVIYWSFSYFREILTINSDEYYTPEEDRTFWVMVGLLFYFVGVFFVDKLLNIIYPNNVFSSNVSYIGYTFNYIFNGFLILICSIKFSENTHE